MLLLFPYHSLLRTTENDSRMLRILRPSFFLQFLTKNDEEITAECSESSGLLCPYHALLKTIRKSLPDAPDLPASLFFAIPHEK